MRKIFVKILTQLYCNSGKVCKVVKVIHLTVDLFTILKLILDREKEVVSVNKRIESYSLRYGSNTNRKL